MTVFKSDLLNQLNTKFFVGDEKRAALGQALSKEQIKKLRADTVVGGIGGQGDHGLPALNGLKTIPEPGWFFRSNGQRDDNDKTRRSFIMGVLQEFGVTASEKGQALAELDIGELKKLARAHLPSLVLKEMKLDDYGRNGRPLSLYRVQTVLSQIAFVKGLDSYITKTDKLSAEFASKLNLSEEVVSNFKQLVDEKVKCVFEPLIKNKTSSDDLLMDLLVGTLDRFAQNFAEKEIEGGNFMDGVYEKMRKAINREFPLSREECKLAETADKIDIKDRTDAQQAAHEKFQANFRAHHDSQHFITFLIDSSLTRVVRENLDLAELFEVEKVVKGEDVPVPYKWIHPTTSGLQNALDNSNETGGRVVGFTCGVAGEYSGQGLFMSKMLSMAGYVHDTQGLD